MTTTETRDDVADVLADSGWTSASGGRDGSLWRSADESLTIALPNLLTPESFEWSGIVERLAYALHVEPQAAEDVVTHRYTDVTELTAEAGELRGSVALTTGVTLVETARTLVRSSATASRSDRSSLDGRYLRSGDELADRARMGHTREGSYVLPIFMPLPRPKREANQLPVERYEESDARRVTRTLAQAVAAVHSQVVEPAKSPDATALHNLAVASVTREAVQAVERLLTAEEVEAVTTKFTWASGLVAPSFLPSRLSIPSEAAPLLHETALRMRQGPKTQTDQFTGPIVKMFDDHQGSAEVWIRTVRRGRPCEIHVTVPKDRRLDAHQWFAEHDMMLVSGRLLSARGKPLRIPEPTRFTRLADTQIF